jgi:catechol 2,3-dioxygenase
VVGRSGRHEDRSRAPARRRPGSRVGVLSQALGLDRIVWNYPGALFLSAGGYHHHLGTNTWAKDAEPAGPDEARLLEWTIEVPTDADVQAVAASLATHDVATAPDAGAFITRDPWGTSLRVRAASSD